MRALSALLALSFIAACSSDDKPEEVRPALKRHLTERLEKLGFKVPHTDDDPRGRPPTKYADATKGLAFTIRHQLRHQDSEATLSTWVYRNKKALAEARKEPFEMVVGDLRKSATLFKWEAVQTDRLKMILLLESPNPALVNVFEIAMRDLKGSLAEIK